MCMHHSPHREVKSQADVSVLIFHLVWEKVSLILASVYARLAGLWTSWNSPVSTSHLIVILGYRHTIISGFKWVLEIRTQVLTLVWQVLYPLNHILSHWIEQYSFFFPSQGNQFCFRGGRKRFMNILKTTHIFDPLISLQGQVHVRSIPTFLTGWQNALDRISPWITCELKCWIPCLRPSPMNHAVWIQI